MKAIICIGNRFDARDAAGPAVYDRLLAAGAIPGVDVIDGGIAGLDLVRFLDGAERVVFVDSVSGFGEAGEVLTIDPAEVRAADDAVYDHGSGLAYLLRVAPIVCERGMPEIIIIGIEGEADGDAIDEAAERARVAALDGCPTAAPAESERSARGQAP
jgi:hydrogenase maturation protease